MTLIHRLIVLIVGVALVVTVVSFTRARAASAEADLALTRMHRALEQIATIERLCAQTPDWAMRRGPALGPGGLATAVNDVLAGAGVPASSLASLSPAPEAPVSLDAGAGTAGAGLAAFKRRAVLTLAPVTLPQVGAVLKAWRESHPDWAVTVIDLTPEEAGRRDPPPGSDLPLRAVLTLETLYGGAQTAPAKTGAPR